MIVDASLRSQGVGSALLASAIEGAKNLGAHKIILEVFPHNERAIRLYERYGFEREGFFRRHYRRRNGELWDALPMGLCLG
jgi:RimJ/RimL family protein N-acetyltransferase